MDQSKKTMRHFYCRDVLWETFEQMANDFDCSIDYLINEAMRYYARSKNYQGAHATGEGSGAQQPAAGYAAPATGAALSSGSMRRVAQPSTVPSVRAPQAAPTVPGTPQYAHASHPPTPPGDLPAVARRSPPQRITPSPEPVTGPQVGPVLFLVFNDQRFPIEKDQFIIGRGSKTSDLAIKDGNISRKHAAVIRRNGTYYIKDLGSTNGIDYKGMRIDNKRIDEGDVFHLCDYELRFTYRM